MAFPRVGFGSDILASHIQPTETPVQRTRTKPTLTVGGTVHELESL